MKRQLGEISDLKASVAQKTLYLEEAAQLHEDDLARYKSMQTSAEVLSMTVKQKDIDLEAHAQMNDTLRESIKSRKGTMQGSSHRAKALEADVAAKESMLEDKQQEISGLKMKIATIETDCSNRVAEKDATTKQIETSHARKLESLNAELAESKRLKQQLAGSVRTLTTASQAAKQDLLRSTNALDEHVLEHQRVIDAHLERISILEKRATSAEQSGQASADVQAYRAERAQLESQVQDLLQRLDNKAAETSSQVKTIRKEHQDVVQSRDAALRQVGELETNLEEANTKLTRISAQLVNSQRAHDASEQALMVLKQKCERLERDVAGAKSGLRLEQQQKSSLEQLVDTLQQTLEEKESQGNMMRSTSREKEDQLVSKSEELIAAMAETAAIRLKYDATVATLKSSRDEQDVATGVCVCCIL